MGEGFGRHGWVRLVVRGGRHFFSGKVEVLENIAD